MINSLNNEILHQREEILRLLAENEKLRAENNEAYVVGLHKGKEAAFIDYGIERLLAENEKLRAALKAVCQGVIKENEGLDWAVIDREALRAAAAALKETGE